MKHPKLFVFSWLILVALAAIPVMAATPKLTYTAWIPYWKKTTGVAETTAHLSMLNKISPFSYTIDKSGLLSDTMQIDKDPWTGLLKTARTKKVAIVPSVLWNDGKTIDQTLSNSAKRQAHVADLVGEALARNFDGLDIDYENKLASTSPYFSLFLKDLNAELHKYKKTLSCTIEARTPPEAKFLTIPTDLEYANDYRALNLYCDEVRLMAYDQGTVDINLNMIRRLGGFYYPIADPAWVRKVVSLAVQDINPRKLVLGVATYGYELEVTDKGKYFDYKKIRSLSFTDLKALAAKTGRSMIRDNAGELALTYRTADGRMRFASFSDSRAIADKVKIAQDFGLAGVAIFKIDGESDNYWTVLK